MTRPRVTLEVAVQSVADAVAAERGGADRLELCSALELDGLTPSLGLFLQVREAVRLPVLVMLRPRSGDFIYTPSELDVMRRDLDLFAPFEPVGFVFGPLLPDGRVNAEAAWDLRQRCGARQAVFHRAFDQTPDLRSAADELAQMSFTRVLTSGRAATAAAGLEPIRSVLDHVGGRIEVLPCGKVRAENAVAVLNGTGCTQLHGSFADRAGEPPGTCERAVSAARRAVDHWAGLDTNASG